MAGYSDEVPVGFRIKLEPGMVTTAALRTGRPARINGERLARRPVWRHSRQAGPAGRGRHTHHGGGALLGSDGGRDPREDFPAGTDSRMADFMKLAAMAIANAQAEQRLRELA